MTIVTTATSVTTEGNSVSSLFTFNFVWYNADAITVVYTDADLNDTTLSPTQYSIALNAAPPGQLWGVGGVVTYPISGSPIVPGTYLTIYRSVPDQQTTAISNQGGFFPQSIEAALDTLCMEIQQIEQELSRALLVPIGWPMTPLQYFIYLLNLYGGGGGSTPTTNNIITITTSTAVQDADFAFLCNAGVAPISVTLPSPSVSGNRQLQFKKIDSSDHAVTIVGTIDGTSNYTLGFTNQAITLQCNGLGWYVFSGI